MKLFYTVIFLLSLATTAFAREESVLARVTSYWAGEGSKFASTGRRLRPGHCAVDPKRIPYGSKVVFPDAVCTAVDTGTAVVSRKAARLCGRTASQLKAIVVDRFFDTKRKWQEDPEASEIFANAREKAGDHQPLFCYAVSESAAETIADIAATLGASRLILGAVQVADNSQRLTNRQTRLYKEWLVTPSRR